MQMILSVVLLPAVILSNLPGMPGQAEEFSNEITAARQQLETLFESTQTASRTLRPQLELPDFSWARITSTTAETIGIHFPGSLRVTIYRDTLELRSFRTDTVNLPRPEGFDFETAERLSAPEALLVAENALNVWLDAKTPLRVYLEPGNHDYSFVMHYAYNGVPINQFMHDSGSVDPYSGALLLITRMPREWFPSPHPEHLEPAVHPDEARGFALAAHAERRALSAGSILSQELVYSLPGSIERNGWIISAEEQAACSNQEMRLFYRVILHGVNASEETEFQRIFVDAVSGKVVAIEVLSTKNDSLSPVEAEKSSPMERKDSSALQLLVAGHLHAVNLDIDAEASLPGDEPLMTGILLINGETFQLAIISPRTGLVKVGTELYRLDERARSALLEQLSPAGDTSHYHETKVKK